MTNAVDVLLAAADLLEVDGWRQEDFGPLAPGLYGCRCADGAIRAASVLLVKESITPYLDAACLMDVKLHGFGFTISQRIASWNDAAHMTESQVISTLRQVASETYEEEQA